MFLDLTSCLTGRGSLATRTQNTQDTEMTAVRRKRMIIARIKISAIKNSLH